MYRIFVLTWYRDPMSCSRNQVAMREYVITGKEATIVSVQRLSAGMMNGALRRGEHGRRRSSARSSCSSNRLLCKRSES